jgi:putative ABC transport system permease protein
VTLRLLLTDLVRRPGWLAVLATTVALAAGSAAFAATSARGFSAAFEAGIARAGADIVIAPEGSSAALRRMLVTGQPAALSFPDPTPRVRAVPGVTEAAAQRFVASAQASCCSAGDVLIVAFDPETDFMIAPWLRRGTLARDAQSVTVGANLKQPVGLNLAFYGTQLNVTGALAPTGWGFFDNAAFVTGGAIGRMVAAGQEQKGVARLDAPPSVVSVVWVRTEGDPTLVAERLRDVLPDADVVELSTFLPTVRSSAASLGRALRAVALALSLAAALVIAGVFALGVERRGRDLALLRACGASRRTLALAVLAQAALVGGVAGLAGGLAGSLAASSFALATTVSAQVPVLPPSGLEIALTALGSALAAAAVAGLAAAGPALAGALRSVSDELR